MRSWMRVGDTWALASKRAGSTPGKARLGVRLCLDAHLAPFDMFQWDAHQGENQA